MAKKYVNPIKEKFYKQYGHKFGTRENFEQNWKENIRSYVGKFGFGRTKEKLSQQVSLIMREQLLAQEGRYGNKNLFNRIEDIRNKNAKEILDAEKEIYSERTEKFREKYGEEVIYSVFDENNNPIDITLNDLYNDYLNGKFSQEQMNNVIETIKQTSTEYLRGEQYDTKSKYIS